MKKLLLFAVVIAAFSIFNACEKEELQVSEPEITNSDLPSGSYNSISEADWDKYIKSYSSSDSYVGLKSATTFESMWDVLLKLDDLAGDSTKVEEYNKLVKQHEKILKEDPWGGYQLITNSAFLAKSFSSDGLLKIGDNIFEMHPESFVEYSRSSTGNYQAIDIEREIEIFPINQQQNESLKSVTWQSPTIEHKFSSSRKVKCYLWRETIPGNYTESIFGAYSKYYKKSWGSWKEHKSRNGIELSFVLRYVRMYAGDFLYYPGVYPPERSTMVAEAIDDFSTPTTGVIVRYFRHPASDGSTPPSVTWYGSDFGL